MVWRVKLTDRAARDLDKIGDWYTQPGSGPAARQKLRRLTQALRNVKTYPYLGAQSRHDGLRELGVEGHRVIYQLIWSTGPGSGDDTILVIRIFGPGQDRSSL